MGIAGGCAAWLFACTSFSGDDPPATEADAAAPGIESGAASDAGSSAGDAGSWIPAGDLVFSEGFDGTGCGAWLPKNGIRAELSDDAFSGAGSCKLCVVGDGGTADVGSGFLSRFEPTETPGAHQVLAWVKNVSLGATGKVELGLKMTSKVASSENSSKGAAVTGDWKLVTTTTDAPAQPNEFEVSVAVTGPIGQCVLVDEVRVVKLP